LHDILGAIIMLPRAIVQSARVGFS